MNFPKLNIFIFAILLFVADAIFSQIGTTIPASRRTNWSVAGVDWTSIGYNLGDPSATFNEVIDVTDHIYTSIGNADPTGVNDASVIIQNLINQSESNAISNGSATYLTLLYFPPGTYRMVNGITFNYGHVVLRGANPSYTRLNFENSGTSFQAIGTFSTTEFIATSKDLVAKTITLSSAPTGIVAGDYIQLSKDMDEAATCAAPYAPNSQFDCATNQRQYGQVVQVTGVSGSVVTLQDDFALDYALGSNMGVGSDYRLRISEISPINMVGIEDMLVNGSTTGDGQKFLFRGIVNSWISGVESAGTDCHHIMIEHCSKMEVRGSYIHHATVYTANAYGIYIGDKSTNCLIENNILTHLRHPIVLSTSMPCRNVIGYNFTALNQEPSNPQQIMLHGYFPNINLFEGNVTGSVDFDFTFGRNGIYNTTFRNKITNYTGYHAISRNSLGNYIVNPQTITDYNVPPDYTAMDQNNCLTGSCTGVTLADKSYYLTSKPSFISSCYTWPLIGPPTSGSGSLSNTNPAETRFKCGGQLTINPKDEFTDHSIENRGLISGFNEISGSAATIYRNKNELSTGTYGSCTPFYSNTTGYWDVGPITTAIISATTGAEEIISSYNNTSNTAAIYRSTSKTSPPVLLWDNGGAAAVVTAMSSGNFWGDSKDELIFAIYEGGVPKIYVTDDYANLEKYLIYTGTSGTKIDALATGNFDADAYAELFTGQNESGNNSRIYKRTDLTPILSGGVWTLSTGLGSTIWTNTNGHWDIDALAVGDFDENGDDELIEGFNSAGGPAMYRSETGTSTVTLIYSGISYWTLAAIAAGDLDNNGDDELITGFNSSSEGPNIYKSEDGLSAGEVLIYDGRTSAGDQLTDLKLISLAIEKVHESMGGPKSAEEITFEEEDPSSGILVYPNPSNGMITLMLLDIPADNCSYEVYNLQGDRIASDSFFTSEINLNLSDYSKGIYFIKVTNGEAFFFEKIVIQ